MGQFDIAIVDLTRAIDLNPYMAEAYSNRGWAYFNVNYFESAIIDLNKAIELEPSLAIAYCNRGLVYYNKAKYDLAKADFNKTIELTKDPSLLQVANQLIKEIEDK